MVKKYSLKVDGSIKLSTNFSLSEFRCKDGSDEILVDDELVNKLQILRNKFGKSVNITSGYRSASYNAKINGASSSKHRTGEAADIQIQGVHPVIVALAAKEVGFKGIGIYTYPDGRGWVHVDVRQAAYYWLQLTSSGGYSQIDNVMPILSLGSRGQGVKLLQRILNEIQDGVFGKSTENALLKKYNVKRVDNNIWKIIFGYKE